MEMRKPLEKGSAITLTEIGTDKSFCFEIADIIGTGASCIVYTAVYTDAQNNSFPVRLKELYPADINITRDPDNSLKYSPEAFESHLARFTDGYQKQLELRRFPESMNSISNIQGIFTGNGTRYIAMSCQNGMSLSDRTLTLYDIFRVMRAVTLQIDNFHRNGYLYLDLKPDNIILYPETPELVMLFDFDSAVTPHELSNNPKLLSFTLKWSAPEVCQYRINKLSPASDIYTIGAMLMYMLLGRSPELSDRRRNASWDDEFSLSPLLSDESPETKRLISEIFRKTLAADPLKRYSSCGELIETIEPFILSFQKEKPYLKTVLPMGNSFFCGRERELSEIHDILHNENFLILHGIGGIGKSELAKNYARRYSEDYDAVIFLRYDESIIETFANDSKLPVVNLIRSDDESDEEYFRRKTDVMRKICTERHLIILDNFDTEESDNLDEITSLPCKFIVTSRVDFEGIFPQLEVDVLDRFEDLYRIFTYWCRRDFTGNEKNAADDIICAVQGHTMAVELIAKQISLTSSAPSEICEKLAANGIRRTSSGRIRELKDGSLRSDTAYAHIETLFDIFRLDDTQKYVLSNLALIGSEPIEAEFLKELCEWDEAQENALDSVITGGWVQRLIFDDGSACTTLHPLISEVLCSRLKPDCITCELLVMSSAIVAANIDDMGNADQRRAHIRWLDHLSENISGSSMELAFFLDKMIYPVYLGEDNYKKALSCIERELEIISELDPDDTEKRMSLYLFGTSAAAKMGDCAASEAYNQKLAQMQLDPDGRRLYHQALLMRAIDANDAVTAKNEAEKLLELALGEKNDYSISLAYGKLVWVEKTFGSEDGAVRYSELGLAHIKKFMAENKLPVDSPRLAGYYDEMAEFCRDAYRYSEAVEYYHKVIEHTEKAFGKDSIHTISTCLNLGMCMIHLADYQQAEEYTQKAADLALNFYGEEHPETEDVMCMCYRNFHSLWLATGDERYSDFSEEID